MTPGREWLDSLLHAARRVVDQLDAQEAVLRPAIQELRVDLIELEPDADAGATGTVS